MAGRELKSGLVAAQGRLFDFGNNKPREQPVNINVGSGVPCGVAARRGTILPLTCPVFTLQCLTGMGALLRTECKGE